MSTEARWTYGCVRCQVWHFTGDELYEPHRGFQSKHGMKAISEREWTIGRLSAVKITGTPPWTSR